MPGPVATSACEALREECREIWHALVEHPFVRELAAGTLPLERFRFYIEQDLLFLDDYVRAIGFAIGRSAADADLRLLTEELQIVVGREIANEQELLERVESLAGPGERPIRPARATVAYGSFLIATAARGDALDVMASLLPCAWSYADIGLAHAGGAADHPVYADWLRFFGSDEYVDSIAARRAVLDRLAAGLSVARLNRLAELFTTATRLELAFWESAYRPDVEDER